MKRRLSHHVISAAGIAAAAGIFLFTAAHPAGGDETLPNLPEDMEPHTTPPTPTPAPEPTPTPEPGPCEFFRVELHKRGESARGVAANPIVVTGEARTTPCIQSYIDSLRSRGKRGDSAYHDDNYANLFARDFLGGKRPIRGQNPNGFTCTGIERFHGGAVIRDGYYCVEAYGYFDSNCRAVSEETVQELCGDVELGFEVNFIKSSPISLLWTPEADIEADVSIARFSLNPYDDKSWCVWKGSAETPLLVYDPEHRGRITSARQLFGEWTFGGRRTASLSAALGELNTPGGPWKDGFAALASLDRNGDGAVRGEELAPLALWFDRNQDAAAQPGEVQPITETGVRALYYRALRREPETGSLYADIGYEREVDGRIITGAAVDWYGETADSEYELVSKQLFGSMADPRDSGLLSADVSREAAPAAAAGAPSVSGIWKWTFHDAPAPADGAPADGFLLIQDSPESGTIQGYSLVEHGFARSPKRALRSSVLSFFFRGVKQRSELGETVLLFESKRAGGKLRSTAQLSSDGRRLFGETEAAVRLNGKNRIVRYRWSAERQESS